MSAPQLFDRALAARRLDRAFAREPADFLLARAADDLRDRVAVVKRDFREALDLGTPGPHGLAALPGRHTARCAPSLASLGEGAFAGVVGDAERLPFAESAFDLVTSLLAMHLVDDLPGLLIQIRRVLRPDGLLLAVLPGGDTLMELRESLIVAESEILGGASPRVIPFADVRALGSLLQRAGFALPVVDSDRVVVRYADMFALIRDLRAMGATLPLRERSRRFARRALFARAAAHYAERFSDSDGRVRATFELVWLSGWAPHPDQPKPLKPGSARMSLEQAVNRKGG